MNIYILIHNYYIIKLKKHNHFIVKTLILSCDIEIKSRKVEPKESIKGEIARTYLYMDYVYPGIGIGSKKNRKLFDGWNQSDPVDEWECERARRIEKIQGNRNEIVMRDC